MKYKIGKRNRYYVPVFTMKYKIGKRNRYYVPVFTKKIGLEEGQQTRPPDDIREVDGKPPFSP